jgi:hypothetical protein
VSWMFSPCMSMYDVIWIMDNHEDALSYKRTCELSAGQITC